MGRLPTYFISHGGGPWPYVPEMRRRFTLLEASLAAMPRDIGGKPRAILMISGHWEEPEFSVMTAEHPGMVYDYYGFPAHTYHVVYPAPGAPDVAERVRELIAATGRPVRTDDARGYDHGVFAPMAVMVPEADVPVLQLSLKQGYDPAEHLAVGRALAPLRDEGVLIVGSGLSWHNLRMMGPPGRAPSLAFDGWLQQALASAPQERTRRLTHWAEAPSARVAHPREDHLIPLMVALGAAEQEAAVMSYHDEGAYGGPVASSFRFGAPHEARQPQGVHGSGSAGP